MDKKELLLRRTTSGRTEEVTLDGMDGEEDIVVSVRGLTREEVKECSGKKDGPASQEEADKMDRTMAENRMIHIALVDPADLSLEDVCAWMKVAPSGDSVKIMAAIQKLSGLQEGAGKRNVQAVRKRRR